jgi:small subunit ribosomal protein S17
MVPTEKKAAPKAAKAKSKAKKPTAAKKAAAALSAKKVEKTSSEKQMNALQLRREVTGVVVSNKMQKTIVVRVERRVRHGLYMKYVNQSRKVKAHDEKNTAQIGDLVRVVETRPLSRDKRYALKEILRRAGQAPEANV